MNPDDFSSEPVETRSDGDVVSTGGLSAPAWERTIVDPLSCAQDQSNRIMLNKKA